MYERQRPLPLDELYSPDNPRAGVLALLKFALWQAIWVEAAPVPGEWAWPLLPWRGCSPVGVLGERGSGQPASQ